MSGRDLRLEMKAIEQRWVLPQAVREAIMKKLARITLSNESKPRDAISAARVILQADGLNQADEHALASLQFDRLRAFEIAQQLGIDQALEAVIEGTASPSSGSDVGNDAEGDGAGTRPQTAAGDSEQGSGDIHSETSGHE